MNIQPSVVIWTVICFSVLMLILHNWLFKPVLALIDSRREKIRAAAEKKAENESVLREHQEKLAEKKAEALEKQKEQAANAVAQIQSDNKKQMEDAKKEYLKNVEAYRENIKSEYAKMIEALTPEMQKASQALAERIISHKV